MFISHTDVGDLRKIGINATVKVHEWGTYMNMQYSHAVNPSNLLGWGNTAFAASFIMYWSLAVGITLLRQPRKEPAQVLEKA